MRVATVLCGLGVDMGSSLLGCGGQFADTAPARPPALSAAGWRAYPEVPPRSYPRHDRSVAATENLCMSPRIVLVPPSADVGEIAREMAPAGFELVLARDGSPEYEAALAGAEYMVCYPNVALRDAFYRAAPRVKLVQLLSAGYDAVDLEAARRARVPVSNNGGANAISVAEHALMLMLAVSRKVVWQHGNVSGGRWRGNGPVPRMYELHGKTLGIVGLGTIGKKVARLARAFGMRVAYYDIVRLSEDAEDALGVRFRLLRELLKSSEVVSLHVPLNASTRHMIGAGELALMKPLGVLIITSRGPVVD